VLTKLHEHGLRLMLDDFGTGYSSLGYLRSFPLDGVKIDRSFIDGLAEHSQDAAIIKAIIEMCAALGLSTIAEGIESEAQLTPLQELGCECVQGYLLCHPREAGEIAEFLARHLDGRPAGASRFAA
jgi:diguanylate cyclase